MDNIIKITEMAGVDVVDRYLDDFARPFVPGEIPNYPQLVGPDGAPVETQATVWQRHADGSVKHAGIDAGLSLFANATSPFTFQDQPTGNNDGFLTPDDILATTFDAVVEFGGQTVSARDLIADEKFWYWRRGPICTTVYIADHLDSDHPYDIGSLRPTFMASFYKDGRIKIEFIFEATNSEALADVTGTLGLYTGTERTPVPGYPQDVKINAATMPSVTVWIGGEPSPYSIDHDAEYLALTGFAPRADLRQPVPQTVVDYMENTMTTADQSLMSMALWDSNPAGAGAHQHLGAIPEAAMVYLYAMRDPRQGARMWEIVKRQADALGGDSVCVRENRAGKNILVDDTPNAGTGYGRILSVSDRPGLKLAFSLTAADGDDAPVAVGEMTARRGWDLAHFWSICLVEYTVTGRFYWLQLAWFFNSWAIAWVSPVQPQDGLDRGPTRRELALDATQFRGGAWQLRTLVDTVWMSPDEDKGLVNADGTQYSCLETTYLSNSLTYALAAEVGGQMMESAVFSDPNHPANASYEWGKANRRYRQGRPGDLGGPNPLGILWRGNDGLTEDFQVNKSVVAEGNGFPQFWLYAAGRAAQLGFPEADKLFAQIGGHYITRVTDARMNPYNIGMERVATVRKNEDGSIGWFSWDNFNESFVKAQQPNGKMYDLQTKSPRGFFGYDGDLLVRDHAITCIPGFSLLPLLSGGQAAYDFLYAELISEVNFDGAYETSNYRWLLVPPLGLVPSNPMNPVNPVVPPNTAALDALEAKLRDISGAVEQIESDLAALSVSLAAVQAEVQALRG